MFQHNAVSRFVWDLAPAAVAEMIRDYEEFERTGSMGDTLLRHETKRFTKEIGYTAPGIALWFEPMAKECYRRAVYDVTVSSLVTK